MPKRVEQFPHDLGTSPAQSPEGSRNLLKQPWQLTLDEFTHRAKTAALTEDIARVERDAKRMSAWQGCMGWGWTICAGLLSVYCS